MNEIEIQREILNQVIKKTIGRIKELQIRLDCEKQDRRDFGMFEDCGSYYQEKVAATEAIIEELISQKISFEKWRNKLKYSLSENN